MKICLYLLIAIVIISCSNPGKRTNDEQNFSTEIEQPSLEKKDATLPHKADTKINTADEEWLTPSYLTADFNNDKIADTAYAVIIEGKKGIKLKHGGKDEDFLIGAGRKFGKGGDDFVWVDSWKLVNDSIAYKQIFAESGDVLGAEEVKLESTAFYIQKEEVGGATIAWIKGEYVWIHQAD